MAEIIGSTTAGLTAHTVVSWVLISLFLCGCATQPRTSPGAFDPDASVPESWFFHGKLGIRSSEGTANLQIRWTQTRDDYLIVLTTTLGQGVARIAGNSDKVTLEMRGEEPSESNDVEALTGAILGWRFPVQQILSWLHGRPARGSPFDMVMDTDGNPDQLTQSGWSIDFQRFVSGSPTKIVFSRDSVRLLLVIKEWQLPEPGQDRNGPPA